MAGKETLEQFGSCWEAPAQSSTAAGAAQPIGSPALGIENSLRWRLDVAMNKDQGRSRGEHEPHNLAVLPTPHSHQRHAKRGLARKVQPRKLGRWPPLPATGAIVKCDCPGGFDSGARFSRALVSCAHRLADWFIIYRAALSVLV